MEVNRILFEQLNSGKVNETFEDLDVNTDGVISETDISVAEDNHIKDAIKTILNAADKDDDVELVAEDLSPVNSLQKSGVSSSARGTSRTGLPLTDVNTFENDVLKSKGTVFVYIGNQYREFSNSFGSCEKLAAANLSEIQKYANVYHLDTVNTDLVSRLRSQAGVSSMYSNCILKFVDGKLVETISQGDALKLDKLLSKVQGEPSKMPDIAPPVDTNPNAPKNQYGVKTTNTANFQNDVLNSRGTVYVTIGNLTSCSYCKELQTAIQQNAQTLNSLATVYDLSTDTDKDLCWQIFRDMGGNTSNTMGLPQIAKFVDGKFVQIMSGRIAEDAVSKMIKLAEGSAKKDKDGIAQTSAATFNDDIKNSKGTTYVMITSATGCQYCNILHNRLKDVWADVQSKFGFYELATNDGADRDLCWQLFRQGGGLGNSMQLPQIAKFVDGKFVELLSNTRDYGKGLDNATIKEMIAKAEGTPVNNANTNTKPNGASSTSTTETQDTSLNTFDYQKEQALFEKNIKKIRNEAEQIEKDIAFKELQKEAQEKKLEELQKKYDKLEEKLKNASDDEDTTSIKAEMSSLKSKIETASSTLKIMEQDVSNLELKYALKQKELSIQNQSYHNFLEKQLNS